MSRRRLDNAKRRQQRERKYRNDMHIPGANNDAAYRDCARSIHTANASWRAHWTAEDTLPLRLARPRLIHTHNGMRCEWSFATVFHLQEMPMLAGWRVEIEKGREYERACGDY